MKYLFQGQVDNVKFELLLELRKFEDPMKKALRLHLVDNFPRSAALYKTGVLEPNFCVALKNLNKAAEIVEKIKEHELTKIKNNFS